MFPHVHCGGSCQKKALATLRLTEHSQGLVKSQNLVTAMELLAFGSMKITQAYFKSIVKPK